MRVSIPLRFSIPLSLAVLGVLLTATESLHDLSVSYRGLEETLQQRALSLSQIIVPNLERAESQGDAAAAADQVARLAFDPDVALALVIDPQNRVRYAADSALRERSLADTPAAGIEPIVGRARATLKPQSELSADRASIHSAFPFYLKARSGEPVAGVAVLYTRTDLTKSKQQVNAEIGQRVLLLAAIVCVACVLVWVYLRASFTREFGQLLADLGARPAGGPAAALAIPRNHELAEIARVLNQTFAELAAHHAALRDSEEKFSRAFRNAPMTMILAEAARGVVREVNEEFTRLTGFARDEIIGKTSVELGLVAVEDREAMLKALGKKGRLFGVEFSAKAKDGRILDCLYTGEIMTLAGQPHIFSIVQDITGRKALEARLQQAQKLESIGQLAGGIAHDFNNILAGMMMHISLLQALENLPADARASLDELMAEAHRAANLTRQLLMFSRKSMLQMKNLDLNEVVSQLLRTLARLLGHEIGIRFSSVSGLPRVQADLDLIEQVMINLSLNARDAMPDGGEVVITLATELIDEAAAAKRSAARPGQFVCLSVADAGCGMDAETLRHVFEPFFTTKDVGRGTGLGLAAVYGIAAQHQGWVEIQSAVGRGTTVSVFLPVVIEEEPARPADDLRGAFQRGTETILFVEDDPTVRRITKQALQRLGYKVFEAADGPEALKIWQERQAEIRLMLTDVMMPGGLSGVELAEQLLAARPDLKVILSSGYSPELIAGRLSSTVNVTRLQKPYQLSVLSATIRACLDGR